MLLGTELQAGGLEACNRLDGGGEGAVLGECGLVRRHTIVTWLVHLVVLATLLLLLLALAPPSPRTPRAQGRQLLAQRAVSRPLRLRSVHLDLPCSLRQPHARCRRLESAHL